MIQGSTSLSAHFAIQNHLASSLHCYSPFFSFSLKSKCKEWCEQKEGENKGYTGKGRSLWSGPILSILSILSISVISVIAGPIDQLVMQVLVIQLCTLLGQ